MRRQGSNGLGPARGRARGRGRGPPAHTVPDLSERVPPPPASSLNTYPEMARRYSPPTRANSSGDTATQPPPAFGFHQSQQQQQRQPSQRQNSATNQETLAGFDSRSEFRGLSGQPMRNGSSPPDSVYSDLSQLKRTAPYAMMSDTALLSEPGPFDSVSQRGGTISDRYRASPASRSSSTDEKGPGNAKYAPSVPSRGPTTFQQAAYESDLRQRMPSVMGNASDFLGTFDQDYRFNSSMSMISDREATSEAWIKRQRIKPGRAKTKKVKLTKGRFIAEYGESEPTVLYLIKTL